MAQAAGVPDFATARLDVRDWQPDVTDPARRAALEDELRALLTERVTAHLPPALALGYQPTAASDWIDARRAECDILLVRPLGRARVIGLMILATGPQLAAAPVLHLGYLLAEDTWGQGFASELVQGLVAAARCRSGVTLMGGVGKGNRASARVLEKAGFERDAAASTPDTDMYCLTLS